MQSIAVGPIGPSTGWLSAKLGSSLEGHSRILTQANVTAAEMVCHSKQRMEDMLQGRLPPTLQYVSLHLSGFQNFLPGARETDNTLEQTLTDVQEVVSRHHIQGAPAHPDIIPSHIYPMLRERSIPVCIENMDRDKQYGKTVEELQTLGTNHELPYILDVQHAYENSRDAGGNGFDLSEQFADMMIQGNGIKHLHVSGEFTNQGKQLLLHAQLHIATNRREIIHAVRSVLQRTQQPLPIILEGEYLLDIPYDYQPRDASEQLELEARCAQDICQEIQCLLNEING